MDKIIEFEGVGYAPGGVDVLTDINFSVRRGETMTVIGKNGSGKSTLFGILLGDFKPSSGKVKYYPSREAVLESVGVVYDNQLLFPMLKVREAVDYFAKIHRSNPDIIARRAAELGLSKIWDRQLIYLSQGERVKVAICLSLLHPARLIVMDEPFANIDPTAVSAIWRVIRDCEATVIITAHDWGLAAEISSRVCFLNEGKLVHTPLSPREFTELLPAKRKIIVSDTPAHRHAIGDTPTYVNHNELVVFSDDPNVLKRIQSVTFNYSVLETTITDAYTYLSNA